LFKSNVGLENIGLLTMHGSIGLYTANTPYILACRHYHYTTETVTRINCDCENDCSFIHSFWSIHSFARSKMTQAYTKQ